MQQWKDVFTFENGTMRKVKIYLDTSVINYLDAPHMPQQMQDTLDLWAILATDDRYEVVLSGIVEQEIFDCPEPKLNILVQKMAELAYSLVPETDEISELAKEYAKFGVSSRKNMNDMLHIAHASASYCQWIISWNFKHFVNFKTMDRVNAVNLIQGFDPVKIASPAMFLGELNHE